MAEGMVLGMGFVSSWRQAGRRGFAMDWDACAFFCMDWAEWICGMGVDWMEVVFFAGCGSQLDGVELWFFGPRDLD